MALTAEKVARDLKIFLPDGTPNEDAARERTQECGWERRELSKDANPLLKYCDSITNWRGLASSAKTLLGSSMNDRVSQAAALVERSEEGKALAEKVYERLSGETPERTDTWVIPDPSRYVRWKYREQITGSVVATDARGNPLFEFPHLHWGSEYWLDRKANVPVFEMELRERD